MLHLSPQRLGYAVAFGETSMKCQTFVILPVLAVLGACGPQSQEGCKVKAARDAKSQAALNILIQECQSEFPALRRDDGTYVYYDPELADWVEVSGPKLTEEDKNNIAKLRAKKK